MIRNPGKITPSRMCGSGLREDGFTMIELLVALGIFAVIITGMFSFLWQTSRNWKKGQDIADITENARQGMNRMTRELRQASGIVTADPTQVSFTVNFGSGDETVTYGFLPGDGGTPGTLWRSSSAGGGQVTMVNDVAAAQFNYFGNDYRCDTPPYDGVITLQELQQPGCNGVPDKIARVDIALTMQTGKESQQVFSDQAWLRNRMVQ